MKKTSGLINGSEVIYTATDDEIAIVRLISEKSSVKLWKETKGGNQYIYEDFTIIDGISQNEFYLLIGEKIVCESKSEIGFELLV